ncbi:hypothetical protein RFI_11926 [Reticulomyxa filosa]|uniref:Ferric reductase NAD binding domain-containing protein n=1 Tax=Reticulomyxa filosa TaxID=46433 RepID=X6NGT9_RETFI|nr:hypothetical protein RFI_11926 [Reticulomyxa filosa]|eukprot:ETO25206.1 hypothetical protein RFI_11926 [Reticulomyxa filosa]
MTNTPAHLKRTGELHLAVKTSSDVISQYVHSLPLDLTEKQSLEVYCKCGGNLYFDNAKSSQHFVLIAGGIGITPLSSIFKFHAESCPHAFVSLLYSVHRDEREFALLDELAVCQVANSTRSSIVCTVSSHSVCKMEETCVYVYIYAHTYTHTHKNGLFLVTKSQSEKTQEQDEKKEESNKDVEKQRKTVDSDVMKKYWGGRTGRIDIDLIKKAVECQVRQFELKSCQFVICGPPSMLQTLPPLIVQHLNISEKQIHFEKWW